MAIMSTMRSALTVALTLAVYASADADPASKSSDSCAKIAGKVFMPPAEAVACQKSFPFNETIRQNVLTVVSRVFNFYTFEDYYLNSPPPFQESTINIRSELAKINATKYETDYDFQTDLYNFVNQLNDGHTGWYPSCYLTFQNILPAPVVNIEVNGTQGVYIAPDSVDFINQLGDAYTSYFDSIKFDWQRLAGAKILAIQRMAPYDYVDYIADTVSGNYLDHNVRVNSVFSSYRVSGNSFSQRLGDLAGPGQLTNENLTFSLITAGSSTPENVTIPYLASYAGANFTDSASYWATNCAATNTTNGQDLNAVIRTGGSIDDYDRRPRAVIVDKSNNSAVGLPSKFLPTAPSVNGSTGVIKSFILPDNKTGVMFVGSFEGDFNQFQTDTQAAITQFQASNVTHLLVDLSNNGGGYVCLGEFLHSYLAGTSFGYAGFQSTMRANPLAQKILAADIHQGLNESVSYYTGDNWAFLNDTAMPASYDYLTPDLPFTVNGQSDPTSQRFHDNCASSYIVPVPETPPFELKNVAIVGNGNCASTCALFSTVMFEQHNTSIAIFGGKADTSIQFKGMAGNQVLEWTDIDTEIKTAGLKDDELAPPDLIVSGDFRHNWRTAWSYRDENTPIAYESDLPQYRFPYTQDTYNNPQNLWTYAREQLFAES